MLSNAGNAKVMTNMIFTFVLLSHGHFSTLVITLTRTPRPMQHMNNMAPNNQFSKNTIETNCAVRTRQSTLFGKYLTF